MKCALSPPPDGRSSRRGEIGKRMKNIAAERIDRRKFLKITAGAAGAVLTGFPRIEAAAPTAELILTNGKIFTMNGRDSIAQALAVRGGRILDAGPAEAIASYGGPGTETIDLQGKTVSPGLIDSHAHLPIFGQRENGWFVKLHGLQAREEIIETLAQKARSLPKGEWISAWGIEDQSTSYFDKEDLDKVTREHPLLAVHTSGQWGFANSLALKLSGIDGNTPSPPGSKVVMQFFGKEPTGALLHYPALQLVRRRMPVPTPPQAREALLFAAKLYAAEGVTAVHDNFFALNTPSFHRAYFETAQAGTLPLRIKIWPYLPNLNAAAAVSRTLFASAKLPPGAAMGEFVRYAREDPRLFSSLLGGFKIAVDGLALWYGSQQQALPMHTPEDLQAMFRLFHRAGHQVSIHAAGDRAVDMILDAIAGALREHPRRDHRHRIEHALCPQRSSLERIKALGVVISTHPQWIHSWGDKWAGLKTRSGVIPVRSYLERGIPVAFGADPPAFPVYQPQEALWQAAKRTTREGTPLDSTEGVSVREALRIQTIGSAFAGFQEQDLGSLEKGKLADLAVWDRDFTAVPLDQVRNTKCVLTVLGGKIVHRL